jgi:hypothetical protein
MNEDEREEILTWIDENLSSFIPLPNNRLWCDISTANVPACVWKIKQRLLELEGLHSRMQTETPDFIVVILPGGFIHKHIDGNLGEFIHYRYNFFIETPLEGGEIYYDDKCVDARECEYVILKAGLHEHWSRPVVKGRRTTMSFGFYIPLISS